MRGLRAAGCGAIAIPCNTAHGWYEEMQAEGLPILHIVDAAADALAKHTPRGTIGLMGTAATLRMRLYQDRLEARGWDDPGRRVSLSTWRKLVIAARYGLF